jgi:hypothetical protein
MRSLVAGLLALVACLPGAVADSSVDQVLARVPDDAGLVVLVPDFGKLVTAVAGFGNRLGIEELKDATPNKVLTEILGPKMGGVDPNGPLAVSLSQDAASPVLILTLADPEAWKRGGQPVEGSSELLAVTIQDAPWFTAVVGRTAVASDVRSSVESALKAGGEFRKRFDPQGRAFLEDGIQGVLWVDVPAWRPVIEPALASAEGLMQMGLAMAGPQAEDAAAIWQWLFQLCRQVVGQTRTYVAGIAFHDDGVRFHDRATFEGEGALSAYLGKVRKSQRDLLRGLPDTPAAVTFGCEWFIPEGVESFGETMLKAVLEMPLGKALREDESAREGLEAARRIYRHIQGYNLVLPAGGQGISLAGLYLCERRGEVLKDLTASMDVLASSKMMSAWGPGLNVKVTRRTEKIASEDAEVFDYVFSAEDEQVQQILRSVYGESSSFYVAPHPEGIAFAFAPGDAGRPVLERLLAASGGKLAERADVAAARKRISPDPQAVILVDMVRSVELGLAMVKSMGVPVPPVKLPGGPAECAAVGVYLGRDWFGSEVFVPTGPIRKLMEAFESAEPPAPPPEETPPEGSPPEGTPPQGTPPENAPRQDASK